MRDVYRKFSDRKFHDGWVASARHYGYDEIADTLEKQYNTISSWGHCGIGRDRCIDYYMDIVDKLLEEVSKKLGDE